MWQEHVQPSSTDKTRSPFSVFQAALSARDGFVAYAPITLVTFFMFCGASWQLFSATTDPARYQCYALIFWFGGAVTHVLPAAQCAFLGDVHSLLPFHLLPLEYPPLTLIPFSLALFAPLAYYQWAFALLMSLTSVFMYWLLLRKGPPGASVLFACYLFLGAVATAQGRFDLLPAALTLLCVLAADHQRWKAAYVALAFGVLLKLYPMLLLPVLFIVEQRSLKRFYTPPASLSPLALPRHLWHTLQGARRWRWHNCCLCLGIIGGITGVFALLNFQGAIVSQVSYFAQRPVQIEAMGSTLLWLADGMGIPLRIVYSYGSLNIESALDGAVSSVGTLCFLLGYVYVLWILWRGKLDMLQGSIAILLVFVATGKVFSPQYLIWLIPLLAYAGAGNAFWLCGWGTISLLTTFIYSYLYSRPSNPLLIPYVPGFFQTVAVRNALFLFVTLAYLLNWFQVRQRKRLPSLQMSRESRTG